MAPPVVPLELTTVRETLFAMTAVDAVNVPMIAVAAQVEELPASVDDALDLSEIVHSGARPPGTRPPRETRATTLSSNASTRGDLGSEGDVSEPYSLVAVARDPPTALGAGPTTGPLISALSPTVDKRPSPVTPGIGRLDLKPLDDGAPIFSDRNPQRVRARAFRACGAFRGHSAPTGVAPAAPSRTRGGALPHPVTGPRPPSLAISSPGHFVAGCRTKDPRARRAARPPRRARRSATRARGGPASIRRTATARLARCNECTRPRRARRPRSARRSPRTQAGGSGRRAPRRRPRRARSGEGRRHRHRHAAGSHAKRNRRAPPLHGVTF